MRADNRAMRLRRSARPQIEPSGSATVALAPRDAVLLAWLGQQRDACPREAQDALRAQTRALEDCGELALALRWRSGRRG